MQRSDGILVKSLKPFMRIIPYIMEKRCDSQNFSKQILCAETIDRYITEKKEQGITMGYMHLFIAAYVRLIAQRPQLNRFIMNNKIYQRNGIFVSMAIKRSLRDEGEETTVKFEFTGRENIFEITEIINEKISEAKASNENNDTDKLVEMVMSLPGIIKKIIVGSLKLMDRHNMLPKSIIDSSPFHTSLFFTYLKSINTNYIYHHLYEFGTTSIFSALGKTIKLPVVENDQVTIKKCCEIGYTMDERICDGFYFAKSLKLLEKYFNDPHILEVGMDEKVEHFQL